VAGAVVVVGLAWVLGLFVPYPVVAATSSQVASRISPRLVDLVAALATGAVGSVALARSDISDTLPGVAIAISLVPPLAVTGLALESGAPRQAIGSFLLFVTNVIAILASGIVIMALYRASRTASESDTATRHTIAFGLVGVLLLAVIVPLWVNSEYFDRSSIRQTGVQAVADHWASAAAGPSWGSATSMTRCWSTLPAPAPTQAWPNCAKNSIVQDWGPSTFASSYSPDNISQCRNEMVGANVERSGSVPRQTGDR
jgi:uncharacterized membrane protein